MAKLRKMLGNIQSGECLEMMALMETQSKKTLASWAVFYAKENYLPVFEAVCPGEDCLRDTISACESLLSGAAKLVQVKPMLKEAAQIARDTADPVAQAAARAVSVACAAVQTPTNTLGFLFYGAAAKAYQEAGLTQKPEIYDALATLEWQRALASFREVLVPSESNPAKIKWNC